MVSNIPGRGLRQRQPSSGPCGQKKIASIRPPTSASSRFMRAWMALSAAMSNRPRARPDWLLAITVCQPAWFSRAIASSAPGTGTHSSADFT